MMEILAEYGSDEIAKVYIARMRQSNDHLVEFVESIQPPIPREKKWVLIISTLYGCPIGCSMCDAGFGKYYGSVSSSEIIDQIDFMISKRFPDKRIPIPKFKIQFARMGDPALNKEVISALEQLPSLYDAPGLLPSISTVGPKNSMSFLNDIIRIKNDYYNNGRFQFQFSIHTTDMNLKKDLIPISTLSFSEMKQFGNDYFVDGDKKITLNFAMCKGYPVDTSVIRNYFDPDKFIIKLTPINPTENATRNNLQSKIDVNNPYESKDIVDSFKQHGFEVILSIGEVEENKIGSNCGMYISSFKNNKIEKRNYCHIS